MSRGRRATMLPVMKGEKIAIDGRRARTGAHLWTERLLSRAQTGGFDGNGARAGTWQHRVDGTSRKCALADECQPGGGPPITHPDHRFVVPIAVDWPDLQCYGHMAPTGRPEPSPPRPSPFFFEAYEGS